jgi:hypothetical protein
MMMYNRKKGDEIEKGHGAECFARAAIPHVLEASPQDRDIF